MQQTNDTKCWRIVVNHSRLVRFQFSFYDKVARAWDNAEWDKQRTARDATSMATRDGTNMGQSGTGQAWAFQLS